MKKKFVGNSCPWYTRITFLAILFGFISCERSSPEYQSHHDHQAYQAIHYIPEPLHIDANKIVTDKKIDEKQKVFIANFLPLVHAANQSILQQRDLLRDIRDNVSESGTLNAKDLTSINTLLFYYRLSAIDSTNASNNDYISGSIDSLLLRIDIVPERLVMAQAITESGWGSSRFCALANNYFGVHCYSKGCGIEPRNSSKSGLRVKKYHSKIDAIRDYLRLLNTGFAFEKFRIRRASMRKDNEKLDPYVLVNYLGKYSEKGSSYLSLLKEIMEDYVPEDLESLLMD